MSECTPECKAAQEQYFRENKAYTTRWPNFCEACCGFGGKVDRYDPSPSGVSLGSGYMEDFDPCPKCYAQGKCPRCASPLCGDFETDEKAVCPACRWSFNNPRTLPPIQAECLCWMADGPDTALQL